MYENKEVKLEDNSLNPFFYCSYSLSTIKTKSLTHILRDAGVKTASIKSSSITSNYWNLQEGVNISIENSTIDLIPYHLKRIKEQFEEDIGAIFIDIDTLHRGSLFFKNEGVDWGLANLILFMASKARKQITRH